MDKIKEIFQKVKHVLWDKARDEVKKRPNAALIAIIVLLVAALVR